MVKPTGVHDGRYGVGSSSDHLIGEDSEERIRLLRTGQPALSSETI